MISASVFITFLTHPSYEHMLKERATTVWEDVNQVLTQG